MHALYIQKIKFNDKIYLKLKCNHYVMDQKREKRFQKVQKMY